MAENKDWFENWFNTEWYHMLYCDRDESEARNFINNLIQFLKPKESDQILDLACGKGRHALNINGLGYQVWGIDLSPHSIEEAQQHENERLHFAVHDMREVFKPNYFHFILNLFTSFGYFNDAKDNQRVMKSVWRGLKPEGRFVLDFLNAKKVKRELIPHQEIIKGDITFHINKQMENNVIVKTIEFEASGKNYSFQERVTAFEYQDLVNLFEPFGLEIEEQFGDYSLGKFDEDQSDRLILIARKS